MSYEHLVNRPSSHTWRDKLAERAMNAVKQAVYDGSLPAIEKQICVDCGAKAWCYDHRNYFKFLDVQPVCRKCNVNRGPAFPPPEAFDGRGNKREWLKISGYKYNNLEGGGGYLPLQCKLVDSMQITRVIQDSSSEERPGWLTSRDASSDYSVTYEPKWNSWARRALFFKLHDPWCPT